MDYSQFRRSNHIDDRRSVLDYMPDVGALIAQLRGNPLPSYTSGYSDADMPPVPAGQELPSSLPAQLGANDIVPDHAKWLAQWLAAQQTAVQNDPSIHSLNEPMDPSGPPVSLDRRKLPFGLGG